MVVTAEELIEQLKHHIKANLVTVSAALIPLNCLLLIYLEKITFWEKK